MKQNPPYTTQTSLDAYFINPSTPKTDQNNNNLADLNAEKLGNTYISDKDYINNGSIHSNLCNDNLDDLANGKDMNSDLENTNKFSRRNALKTIEIKRLNRGKSINRSNSHQLGEISKRPISVICSSNSNYDINNNQNHNNYNNNYNNNQNHKNYNNNQNHNNYNNNQNHNTYNNNQNHNNYNNHNNDSHKKRLSIPNITEPIMKILTNNIVKHNNWQYNNTAKHNNCQYNPDNDCYNAVNKRDVKSAGKDRRGVAKRLSFSRSGKKRDFFNPDTSQDERPKLKAHVYLTETHSKASRVKERCLFLYKDLLIIGKLNSQGKYKLKEKVRLERVWVDVFKGDVSRAELSKQHPCSPKQRDTALVIGWPDRNSNIVATFDDRTFRDHWFNELISRIKRLREKDVTSLPVKVEHQDLHLSTTKTMMLNNEEDSRDFLKRCLNEFRINQDSSYYQLVTRREGILRYLDGIETPFYLLLTPPSNHSTTWASSDTFFLLQTKHTPGKLFFGRPLEELSTAEGRLHPFLMQILENIYIHGPVTEGVFRKEASPEVKRTKENLEKGRISTLEYEPTVNCVSLLKALFNQLPGSLLTLKLYQDWMKVSSIQKEDVIKIQIKKLLRKLPQANLATLYLLLSLLKHLSFFSHQNLMNIHNLSTCISQCLLWPPHNTSTTSLTTPQQINDAKQLNLLIEVMIKVVDEIFVYRGSSKGIFVGDVSVTEEDSVGNMNEKPFEYLDEKVERIIEEKMKSKIDFESSRSLRSSQEDVPASDPKAPHSRSNCEISTRQTLLSKPPKGFLSEQRTRTAANFTSSSNEHFSSFDSNCEDSSSSCNSSPVISSSFEIYFEDSFPHTNNSAVVSDMVSYNTSF